MDAAAIYSIRVKGALDERWSDYVQGMRIRRFRQSGDVDISVLTGELPDQAALLGVLTSLYNMAFPLLSVELVYRGEEPQGHPG